VPLSGNKRRSNTEVSARLDGEYFRVFYRHHYPNGVEETRDTHHFRTFADAEEFVETMRRAERFYRNPN
jgi:hypothetical protein